MRWRSGGAAVLAALVLSACGQSVHGTGVGVESEPLRASAALGDLRTLDPCTLVPTSELEGFGQARVTEHGMDTCEITINGDGGAETWVRVGPMMDGQDVPGRQDEVRTLAGDAQVMRSEYIPHGDPAPDAPRCVMRLVYADDVALRVLVEQVPGHEGEEPTEADYCEIAETGVTAAYRTSRDEQVEHWQPADDSLARLSACGLLRPAQIAAQFDVDEGELSEASYSAQLRCTWGKQTNSTPTATLYFGSYPEDLEHAGGELASIEGRDSVIRPQSERFQGVDFCIAATPHRQLDIDAHGGDEGALLGVHVPPSIDAKACDIAEELAERVWPKLPDA